MIEEQFIQEMLQKSTPYYLFDLDLFRQEITEVRQTLDSRISLCYAMKANPFLVHKAEPMVEAVEVCSYGEYLICRQMKIPPEKMVISGVLKKPKELEEILDICQDKSVYTIESLQQYEIISRWCSYSHQSVRVLLRLTSGNQFGMDEDTIQQLIARESKKTSGFRPVIYGLHYFSGTQKQEGRTIKEIQALRKFIEQVERTYNYRICHMEFGPGLKIDYFPDKKVTGSSQEMLRTISHELCKFPKHCDITIEMGRGFAATCGYYVTQVQDVKESQGRHYAIVDGGIHQLQYDGQIRGMYQPEIVNLSTVAEDTKEVWNICGSLCTVNDVLCQNRPGPLHMGDYLAFARAGAYGVTEGMALFLSHELPAVYTCETGEKWTCLRKHQETYSWNCQQDINWN